MMQKSFISHRHHLKLLKWKKNFYHDIHLLGWIMHVKAHKLQNANEIRWFENDFHSASCFCSLSVDSIPNIRLVDVF